MDKWVFSICVVGLCFVLMVKAMGMAQAPAPTYQVYQPCNSVGSPRIMNCTTLCVNAEINGVNEVSDCVNNTCPQSIIYNEKLSQEISNSFNGEYGTN